MRLERVLLNLLRIGAGIQVLLGIALWSGHGSQYLQLHMGVGVAFVLLLWALAVSALMRRTNRALAVFAIAWGLGVAGFGVAQQTMMPGNLHWIIRVLHLAVGLAAIPIAERLARSPAPPPA
jgi:hypothetical protein